MEITKGKRTMEITKFDIQYASIRRAIIERRFARLNEMQRV